MRVCVFAHYDKHDQLDEYVIYYIGKLLSIVDKLIFVSVSRINNESVAKLKAMGAVVSLRENRGYDFASYQCGIDQLNLDSVSELVLCNDSVYGPFFELSDVFRTMRGRHIDVWSVTASTEISYHLQSYFLVFGKKVLASSQFLAFWRQLEQLDNKRTLIRRYEVGLSTLLMKAGFRLNSYIALDQMKERSGFVEQISRYIRTMNRRWREKDFYLDLLDIVMGKSNLGVNPTHADWKSLIAQGHMPFVKIELLRDNPKMASDVDEVYDIISQGSNYPVQNIVNHLKRMNGSRQRSVNDQVGAPGGVNKEDGSQKE